jgi:polyferredoxin
MLDAKESMQQSERLIQLAAAPPATAAKKRLIRRAARDYSQPIRVAFQILFLALNLAIGIKFWLFVRYCESGGTTLRVARPPGVEGWLPIASLMNLKAFVLTWEVPRVHPAGLFLLLAFLAICLLARKAFCSWLCPVGAVSEWLWRLGAGSLGRNLALPRWLDVVLRGLKYLLLTFFLWAVGGMSVPAVRAFLDGQYGLIADVKVLNFFRRADQTTVIALGVLVLGSILIKNLWCRYLCPYGALLGLLAVASPARIRRETGPCVDCGKCARVCPQTPHRSWFHRPKLGLGARFPQDALHLRGHLGILAS